MQEKRDSWIKSLAKRTPQHVTAVQTESYSSFDYKAVVRKYEDYSVSTATAANKKLPHIPEDVSEDDHIYDIVDDKQREQELVEEDEYECLPTDYTAGLQQQGSSQNLPPETSSISSSSSSPAMQRIFEEMKKKSSTRVMQNPAYSKSPLRDAEEKEVYDDVIVPPASTRTSSQAKMKPSSSVQGVIKKLHETLANKQAVYAKSLSMPLLMLPSNTEVEKARECSHDVISEVGSKYPSSVNI